MGRGFIAHPTLLWTLVLFGVTPCNPQEFLLLFDQESLRQAQEALWDAWDQTQVNFAQGKCPTICLPSPLNFPWQYYQHQPLPV